MMVILYIYTYLYYYDGFDMVIIDITIYYIL